MHGRIHFIRYTTATWDTATQATNLSLIQLLSCKNKFGFEPIQSFNITLNFEDAERIPNIPSLSFKRSRKTCNLIGSPLISATSSPYAKSNSFLSNQTSILLHLHEDGINYKTISVTKLERKDKRRQTWWTPLIAKSGECSLQHELGFGCLHAKSGQVRWNSSAHPSARARVTGLHDLLGWTRRSTRKTEIVESVEHDLGSVAK